MGSSKNGCYEIKRKGCELAVLHYFFVRGMKERQKQLAIAPGLKVQV